MPENIDSVVRIVIADDEKRIISLIKRIVDWNKYNCKVVGEAFNGIEALDLIEKEHPDIVLTDIRMPGMDGITLMTQVSGDFPEMCFIFISGYNEFEYAQSAVNLGALGYVLKPVDKQQIESLIEKGIRQLKQKQENKVLKQLFNGSMDEYLEIFDSFVNKELYAFFDSGIEGRLITAIKLNNREEAIQILNDIYKKVEESKLSLVHVKKLGTEICMSYLKYFLNELDHIQSNVSFAAKLKDCKHVADVKEFLHSFTDRIIQDLSKQRSNSSGLLIDKVKRFIAENIDKELSLNRVSQFVFMNPAYFSEFFKKETGENFIEYVTKYRLKMAKEFLENTEMKMNEISVKIGYGNLNYFYKVFKKYEGVTPIEYRKLKRTV